MQTKAKERDTAADAPTRSHDDVRRRARRLTGVLVGVAAILAAAGGVVAATDDPKDGPHDHPTTQVIPFTTTYAPIQTGGGVDG
jgi:hypothetical protein